MRGRVAPIAETVGEVGRSETGETLGLQETAASTMAARTSATAAGRSCSVGAVGRPAAPHPICVVVSVVDVGMVDGAAGTLVVGDSRLVVGAVGLVAGIASVPHPPSARANRTTAVT